MVARFAHPGCALAAWLLTSVAAPICALAQNPPAKPSFDAEKLTNAMILPLFVNIAMRDVRPVVANLLLRSGNDPKLRALLPKVKLEGFATFAGPFAAQAVKSDHGRSVQFGLSFIGSTKAFSRFVVARKILSSNPQSNHVRFMKSWKAAAGLSYRHGLTRGRAPTLPTFDIWNHINTRLQVKFLEEFADQAYRQILAWVVLHEIGHHYLGHLNERPRNNREQRARESNADVWAIQKMQTLGYPTEFVMDFLRLQSDLEHVMYAGKVVESGSHPSWRARRRRLVPEIRPQSKEPPIKIIQSVVESKNSRTGGRYLNRLLLIFPVAPRDYGTLIGGVVLRAGLGKTSYIHVATESDGNRVRLYGRLDATRSIVFTIENAFAHVARITVRHHARDPSWPRAVGLGFTNQFVHQQAQKLAGGPEIGAVFSTSPRTISDFALSKAVFDDRKRRRARAIIGRATERNNRIFLEYSKGQHSATQLAARWAAHGAQASAELKKLLGATGFARYEVSLLGNKVVSYGLSRAMKSAQTTSKFQTNAFARIFGQRRDLLASKSFPNGVRLRATPRELKYSARKRVIDKYGFFNRSLGSKSVSSGFPNRYRVSERYGSRVVMDDATTLVWQAGGSSHAGNYVEARDSIRRTNRAQFAGYTDWRLPTIEEVLSLNEPEYYANQLHVRPLFGGRQTCLWTSDTWPGHDSGRYHFALNLRQGLLTTMRDRERCFVRAVRGSTRP